LWCVVVACLLLKLNSCNQKSAVLDSVSLLARTKKDINNLKENILEGKTLRSELVAKIKILSMPATRDQNLLQRRFLGLELPPVIPMREKQLSWWCSILKRQEATFVTIARWFQSPSSQPYAALHLFELAFPDGWQGDCTSPLKRNRCEISSALTG